MWSNRIHSANCIRIRNLYTHQNVLNCFMLNHRNRTEPLARFGILFCSFHSLTAYSSFSFSFSLSAHGTTKKFPISGYRFLPWKTSNVKSPTGVWTFSTIYIIFDIVIFPLSNPNAFVFTFDVLVWSEFSIFFFISLWLWAQDKHEICIFSTYLFAFQHFSFLSWNSVFGTWQKCGFDCVTFLFNVWSAFLENSYSIIDLEWKWTFAENFPSVKIMNNCAWCAGSYFFIFLP